MLVIGRRGHVEVEGIVGDLARSYVIERVDEVTCYPSRRLGIVCQTTLTDDRVTAIRDAVAERNPEAEITFVDTICLPTREHQRSVERLLDRVDAVVVVGGQHSNNTRALAERCRARGKPALHVQTAEHLDAAWFKGIGTVGLTAGTSTLPETIEEVHRALVWIGSGPFADASLAPATCAGFETEARS